MDKWSTITYILMLVSGVLGYYLGHRGATGVMSDLEDVKKDIQHLRETKANAPVVVATN